MKNKKAVGISLIWLLTLLPPVLVGTLSPIRKSDAWHTSRPAFAPPALVFPVVWSLLYIAAASALTLQIFWASNDVLASVKWTAVALVCAHLIIGFAWPVVWNANRVLAAIYMILAMLALLMPGIILTAKVNIYASALWSVMAVWLIFALILSTASATKRQTKGTAAAI